MLNARSLRSVLSERVSIGATAVRPAESPHPFVQRTHAAAPIAPPWPAGHLLGREIRFRRGTSLAECGSPVNRLYLINSGVARRFVVTADSHTFAGLRTSGWLLGAVPALTSGTFDSTTVALTDCAVQPLPLDKFREALSDLKVSRWINQVLAAEAKNEIARTAAAAGRVFPPVIEEVFIELMLAAGLPCADGSIRLTFPLTVTEVGGIVGASRECASRILSDLQSLGVVTHVNGRFTIPTKSRLIEPIRCRYGARGLAQDHT